MAIGNGTDVLTDPDLGKTDNTFDSTDRDMKRRHYLWLDS
jgi:hypothetical protein